MAYKTKLPCWVVALVCLFLALPGFGLSLNSIWFVYTGHGFLAPDDGTGQIFLGRLAVLICSYGGAIFFKETNS